MVVLEFLRYGSHKGNRLFLCRCDCGAEAEVWNTSFYRAWCCCKDCRNRDRHRHGMSGHPLVGLWRRIARYVAGWEDFHVFRAQIGDDKPFPTATLGPKDVTRPLACDNWQWVDVHVCIGMKVAKYTTILGVTHSKSDWAGICKITKERMRQRLDIYQPVEAVSCYPSAVEYFRSLGKGAEVENWLGARYLQLMDGEVHTFKQGVDFHVSHQSVRQQLHTIAKQHGQKVTIKELAGQVIFCFKPRKKRRKKAG